METLMPRKLNHRQERFIYEYLKDQNASAAAVRAGYSARTKGTHAAELMRNSQIAERIAHALSDMYASQQVTALRLIQHEAQIAFFDPRKMFDGAGKLLPLDVMDPALASVLTIHVDDAPDGGIRRRIRQPARQQALGALERRYAKFMEMQLALLERAREEEGLSPPASTRGAPRHVREPVLDLQRMRDAVQPVREVARGPTAAPRSAPQAAPGADAVAARQAAMALVAQEVPMAEGSPMDAQATDVIQTCAPPAGALPLGTLPTHMQASVAAADVPASPPAPPKYKRSAFREAMDELQAESHARAVREALAAGLPPPAPKGPPDPNAPYDFRKDPNWMWGGRVKPVPPPEKGWVELEAEANAQWRKQNAELLASTRHLRVRPGAAIMPARMEPGYNPPWLRRDRPAVGDPGPVFYDDED